MTQHQSIIDQISQSITIKQNILADADFLNNISKAASLIIDAYSANKKTLIAGNGGSAGDAQHIAGEFVSRLNFDRPGLPSIALTTDTSILTAIANDYGFNKVFSRQVQAQGNAGDVFIGISTSGNSADVIEALKICKEKGIPTIGLLGNSGGLMAEFCDVCLTVPSTETPRIQESHIMIGHIICCLVEDCIFAHLKPVK